MTYVEPTLQPSASAKSEPRHFGTVAVARAALATDVLLLSHLWLSMGVACDVDLSPNRYDILAGGTTLEPVVKPWVVQPSLFLGVAWELTSRVDRR